MRNIIFKSIAIEGFGSFIKPTKFILNRQGVNIITGPNGAGKTTMFSALLFCLYKENLKGLTLAKLPTKEKYRDSDWRGTRVVVTFDIDGISFLVARHISFKGTTKGLTGESKLMIYRNGKLENKELHKGDMEAYIVSLLGIDSKTFLNSILFGQRMKKFIESKPDEKRKVFESVFDIDFIDIAKENAKKHKDTLESTIESNDTSIDNKEDKIEDLEEQLEKDKKLKASFKKDKEERLEKISKELESEKLLYKKSKNTLDLKIKELSKYNISKYNKLVDEDSDIEDKIVDLEDNIKHENKSIVSYKRQIEDSTLIVKKYLKDIDNVDTKCPVCDNEIKSDKIQIAKDSIKTKIGTENKVKDINNQSIIKSENKIKEFNKSIEALEKESKDLNKQIDSFGDIKEIVRSIDTNITVLKTNNKNYESNIKKIESNYATEEVKKLPKINLKYTEKKIKDLELEVKELTKENSIKNIELQKTDWWIKTGFGSSGLKSYVYNSMLTLLNKSIEKYSSRLGFKMIFSIDMTKKSKPFLTKCYGAKGVEFDYDEFSGGEKARVDVSAAFAMHDLVSSTVDINLLIMDEIFEGLDGSGIEDVGDLIKLKCQGKTLYVITHLNNVDFGNCKRLDFSKINNSTIIE